MDLETYRDRENSFNSHLSRWCCPGGTPPHLAFICVYSSLCFDVQKLAYVTRFHPVGHEELAGVVANRSLPFKNVTKTQ